MRLELAPCAGVRQWGSWPWYIHLKPCIESQLTAPIMIIDVAKAASYLEEARFLLAALRQAHHAASSHLPAILRGPKANPAPHTAKTQKDDRLWPGYPTQVNPSPHRGLCRNLPRLTALLAPQDSPLIQSKISLAWPNMRKGTRGMP